MSIENGFALAEEKNSGLCQKCHCTLVSNSTGSRRLCSTQQNTLTIFSDLGMSMINISSHLVKTSDSPRGWLGLRGKRNKVINHNRSLAACRENVDLAFIYSTSLCMCLHMFTDLFPLLLPN